MQKYTHTVKYYETDRMGYETDRMGFTHHSNYVRWMEEARIDMMDQLGWSYKKFEDEGLISPVTSVKCRFRHTTTFPDVVNIEVLVEEFRGIKLKLKYIMTNENGDLVCEAFSEHCFLDAKGNLVKIKYDYPEFYKALNDLIRKPD